MFNRSKPLNQIQILLSLSFLNDLAHSLIIPRTFYQPNTHFTLLLHRNLDILSTLKVFLLEHHFNSIFYLLLCLLCIKIKLVYKLVDISYSHSLYVKFVKRGGKGFQDDCFLIDYFESFLENHDDIFFMIYFCICSHF